MKISCFIWVCMKILCIIWICMKILCVLSINNVYNGKVNFLLDVI